MSGSRPVAPPSEVLILRHHRTVKDEDRENNDRARTFHAWATSLSRSKTIGAVPAGPHPPFDAGHRNEQLRSGVTWFLSLLIVDDVGPRSEALAHLRPGICQGRAFYIFVKVS